VRRGLTDEPTAGLDAASEQAVNDAIGRLMKRRTSVVIAHHLDTIRRSDVIFAIKDAELVESGTHEALLAQQGMYAGLYWIQTARKHEGTAAPLGATGETA
jgi:ABC-type multidrug transport system fused ATPase/permease subunit